MWWFPCCGHSTCLNGSLRGITMQSYLIMHNETTRICQINLLLLLHSLAVASRARLSETTQKWFETSCYAFGGRSRRFAKRNVNKVIIFFTVGSIVIILVASYSFRYVYNRVTLCRRVASDPWRQPPVVAPLHPALSLASRLMQLLVASFAYPLSVSSLLCLGIPLLLAPFILPGRASRHLPSLLLSPGAQSSLMQPLAPLTPVSIPV